ncbi:MAG TPA: site-2 protease family protein, partial [Flavisolibacter sp.]|nr:site-2 protease family protein [Flavisolibacter sp.]
MKGFIKLLRVKGISLYLHVTLLFFVVWLFVLFVMSGMHTAQLLWSLLFLVALFGTVFLHELGHAVMASFFGINAKKITLYPIGGIASIEK